MKTFQRIQWTATALAVVMMVGPYPLYAAAQQTTSRSRAVISDIRLADGGLLEGRLVDSQARPIEQTSVSILHDGLKVAQTKTDVDGTFQVAGLRGGVHQIAGPSGTATCRLWQQGMAPPAARETAVVISRGPLVRGQQTACQTGCQTVCQTVCPPGCQPAAAQQAVACLPSGRVVAQPVATVSPSADRAGTQVQYQEAVPGSVPGTVPGTVQGPPAGPYAQPSPGFQTWGWSPRVRDLLIATAIAAAIAIPIAVANSGSGS